MLFVFLYVPPNDCFFDNEEHEIESWGTLESYLSDHKPLYIALK